MVRLTNSECFLLEWLGKEDFSSYGECHGEDLNRLVNIGFAHVEPGTVDGLYSHYSRVSLTDAGRAALSQVKE